MVRLLKPFLSGLFFLCVLLSFSNPSRSSSQHLSAFTQFVASGNFQQANFYLRQGYVQREDIDSSKIYFRIIVKDITSEIALRPQVYEYLKAINPIDLNQRFMCRRSVHSDYEIPCYLVNLLAHGSPIAKFHFFAQRGLNLNGVFPDAVPAPFILINRLGTELYSLANVNQLTSLGLIMGDEVYDPSLLKDRNLRNVVLPLDTGAVTSFHFMDVLTISLANVNENRSNRYYNLGLDDLGLSRRDELMCSFISHSAQKFAPSFDYLSYLMDRRVSFRAKNLRAAPSNRNVYFRAFPHACVQLVSALARSHPRLEEMVSQFAAKGDVQTAQWLLTFQQQR